MYYQKAYESYNLDTREKKSIKKVMRNMSVEGVGCGEILATKHCRIKYGWCTYLYVLLMQYVELQHGKSNAAYTYTCILHGPLPTYINSLSFHLATPFTPIHPFHRVSSPFRLLFLSFLFFRY